MIKVRLDKECAVSEAQDECLMLQSAGHRIAHEMRFENISKSPREVERKSREDLKSEVGDTVSGQSKVSGDLAKQVRDMRDTLQIAFVMASAKSEIQGFVTSDDQATQRQNRLLSTRRLRWTG